MYVILPNGISYIYPHKCSTFPLAERGLSYVHYTTSTWDELFFNIRMAGDESFILPEEIRIVPVANLPPPYVWLQTRDNDVAIVRRERNHPLKIIDCESAAILEEFRRPATLSDAVLCYSNRRGRNPDQVLNMVLTLFRRLRNARILVPANGWRKSMPPEPDSLYFGEYKGIELLHRGSSDIYIAEDRDAARVVMKIKRNQGENPFLFEAAVLEHLGGLYTPSLCSVGSRDGCHYLVEEHIPGRPLAAFLDERGRTTRSQPGGTMFERIDLAHDFLQAIIAVHRKGVIHGEIHPRNIIVGAGGEVKIIDFRHAIFPAVPGDYPSGECDFTYYEPGYIRSALGDLSYPPMNFRHEQYAVAAIMFHLLTGEQYVPPGAPRSSGNAHGCGREDCDEMFSPANVARLFSRALAPELSERYTDLEEFSREVMGAGNAVS